MIKESMLTVLYVTHEHDIILGSTHSLLNMIAAVKTFVNPIVLLPKEGIVSRRFEEAGVRCVTAEFPSNITDKKGWRYAAVYLPRMARDRFMRHKAFRKLDRQLNGEKIDLIHSNSSVVNFGYILAERYRVPHIWHLRELIDRFFGFKPFGGWDRFYRRLDKAKATISISNTVRDNYLHSPKHSDFVLYDAVRSSEEARFVGKKKPYFMVCGAITKSKGVETAIEAFRIFNLRNRGYRLLLIGNCEDGYRRQLTKSIAEKGLNGVVELLPYTDRIETYYLEASGLLMCSCNEGLGRVTVEAMFFGCPVIGCNEGATKEIIDDGKTGLLFDTEEQCAEAMLRILEPGYMHLLTSNAVARAKALFSEEVFRKGLIDIYSTATGRIYNVYPGKQ